VTAGFLVVDKPSGITSHDVVDHVRRATGIKKAGHAGTLDPMATGVVIVAVGRVTRLIRFLQDLEKEYLATAMFGVGTDTLDADGQVVATQDMTVTMDDLMAIRSRFLGEVTQVPPMVSALKRDGKRLYDLAREGVEVEREPRTVTISELEFLSVTHAAHPLVSFRVVCSKGTYVRSLADDMAAALGGFAHLTELRRTRTGPLTEASAVTVDALADWEEHLIAPAGALEFMPSVGVGSDDERLVSSGRPIGSDKVGLVRVLDSHGTLLAVYRGDGTMARPEVVLA
jgi:tRNA pseudouridine55 synthase